MRSIYEDAYSITIKVPQVYSATAEHVFDAWLDADTVGQCCLQRLMGKCCEWKLMQQSAAHLLL